MQPRICVACLAAYNNGKHHFAWIDADQEPEDIEEEVQEMLSKSPEPDAEEWAIHDYQDFGPLELDESESFNVVSQKAQLLVTHGKVFGYVLNNVHGNIHQAVSDMDSFLGKCSSLKDYFWDQLEETNENWAKLPTSLKAHFDFDSYIKQELRHHYYWYEIDGEFYIFHHE